MPRGNVATGTAAPAKAAAKALARPSRVRSQAEICTHLAAETGLTRGQVADIWNALVELIRQDLTRKGAGRFKLHGVATLRVVRKAATREKRVPNPFKSGEMMTVRAKPARNVVKITPLKALRESV